MEIIGVICFVLAIVIGISIIGVLYWASYITVQATGTKRRVLATLLTLSPFVAATIILVAEHYVKHYCH